MTQEFNNDIVFWLKMGYGILRINYRGSLGKFIINMAIPVIEFHVREYEYYFSKMECKLSKINTVEFQRLIFLTFLLKNEHR